VFGSVAVRTDGARRQVLTVIALLSFTAVFLFGGGVGAVTSSHQVTAQLRRALTTWARFPVDAPKRPLVLIGNDNVDDPASGFTGPSNGYDKLAYDEGDIDPPPTFPSGPPSADGYPLVNASQAFNLLTATPSKGPPTPVRLQVTTVTFGAATFQTDRGPRRLPAWLFLLEGVTDPAAVLAVARSAIFSPRVHGRVPFATNTVGGATSSRNGRTLTVEFGGEPAGTGPCTGSYTLNVAESRTAVAVAVRGVIHDPDAMCALPGHTRTATVILTGPVGNRVVVDAASSNAVPVTTHR
jgi:hypothetical protein